MMRPIFPLSNFDPSTALPESFISLKSEAPDLSGTVVRFPVGTWDSLESALLDPGTVITRNGFPITPVELKALSHHGVKYCGAKK